MNRFVHLLNKINDGSRVLVFCETKKGVDEVAKLMRCDGWHTVRAIHGDKSQSVRHLYISDQLS